MSVGINAQSTKPLIQSKLEGTVVDEITNEPVIGVSINIKGTTHGVSTDLDGKFYFQTGQKLPYTLILSYIGYKKKEIIVDGSPVTIKLSPDVQELNELVIVGYGTQSRKSVVGSISKIKAEDVQQTPVASFDAQLQGRAAGLQVNTFSGTPGEGVKVQVRGTAFCSYSKI